MVINTHIQATTQQIESILDLLKRSGDIYEPKHGFIKLLY